MTEDNKEEIVVDAVAAKNSLELNGKKLELIKMHIPGTKTIANGIKLGLEHLFGIPNNSLNPFMIFYYDNEFPKGKSGIFFHYSV